MGSAYSDPSGTSQPWGSPALSSAVRSTWLASPRGEGGTRSVHAGAGGDRGATVVTDVSDVQLGLNDVRLRGTDAERTVERRELPDVSNTSRYADGEFDAVVAFGGPLSYAFERTDEAMAGLLRVVRRDGLVVASVMSLLGTWRYFLRSITTLSETVGEDAHDEALRTGDLRHVARDPGEHICRMFRWSDLEALVGLNEGRIVDGSASNGHRSAILRR